MAAEASSFAALQTCYNHQGFKRPRTTTPVLLSPHLPEFVQQYILGLDIPMNSSSGFMDVIETLRYLHSQTCVRRKAGLPPAGQRILGEQVPSRAWKENSMNKTSLGASLIRSARVPPLIKSVMMQYLQSAAGVSRMVHLRLRPLRQTFHHHEANSPWRSNTCTSDSEDVRVTFTDQQIHFS